MSTITTAGTWIRLPTALGADDRARADQSGDAALFQIIASNATLATREGELRTLWERGPVEVWADCTETDDERTLRWSGTEADGVLAQYVGTYRVRLYGETSQPPKLVLACRGAAPAAQTLGVIVMALPVFAAPDPGSPMTAVARTTSTTAADLTATITLTPEALGMTTIAPPATGSPPAVDETGRVTSVDVFVGAWCTSGSGGAKASLGGMVVYLKEPS